MWHMSLPQPVYSPVACALLRKACQQPPAGSSPPSCLRVYTGWKLIPKNMSRVLAPSPKTLLTCYSVPFRFMSSVQGMAFCQHMHCHIRLACSRKQALCPPLFVSPAFPNRTPVGVMRTGLGPGPGAAQVVEPGRAAGAAALARSARRAAAPRRAGAARRGRSGALCARPARAPRPGSGPAVWAEDGAAAILATLLARLSWCRGPRGSAPRQPCRVGLGMQRVHPQAGAAPVASLKVWAPALLKRGPGAFVHASCGGRGAPLAST